MVREWISWLSAPAKVSRRKLFPGHIPELDGIRVVGMAMVLLAHFWPKSQSLLIWQMGQLAWVAMDAFFVLSGFLITGILLDSRLRPDYYSTYYVRRSARIFPLYYCVIGLTVCAMAFWKGGSSYDYFVRNWGSPWWFFAYLGNYATAMAGAWPPFVVFIPLWSLQIEEQYYLLFPFAVRRLRQETLSRILWLTVFLSPALRAALYWWHPENPYLEYVLLPCRMEGLALGGLIAIRFRAGQWEVPKGRLTVATIALMLITAVASILSNFDGSTLVGRTVGYSLSSVTSASLVLWLICFRGSRLTSCLRVPLVQYFGKISYGIYLLHQPVWVAAGIGLTMIGWNLPPDSLVRFALLTALSILCASASWHLMERPLLRLKNRFTPRIPAPPSSEQEASRVRDGAALQPGTAA